MGEVAVLKEGRKYFPASVYQLDLKEDGNSIRLGDLRVPLFPGPTLLHLVELEERSDERRYNRIKGDAIKRIQKKFEQEIDIKKLGEIRRNYKMMHDIAFKVLPWFASPPKLEGGYTAAEGVTLSEKEVINYLLNHVNRQNYRTYEEQAKNILNITNVDSVEVSIDKLLGQKRDPWTIFKGYLRYGFRRRVSRQAEQAESQPTEEAGIDTGKQLSDVVDRIHAGKGLDRTSSKISIPKFLSGGLEGEIFLIEEPVIYQLNECSDDDPKAVVEFDGEHYARGKLFDALVLKYAIREGVKRKAIEEEKNRIIQSLRRIKDEVRANFESNQLKMSALLMMLSDMQSFEIERFGFNRRPGGSYVVYAKSGDYILDDVKDGTGLYYFESCRVGVKVTRSEVSAPFIIDRYKHPSLNQIDAPNQEICLANAPLPGKGRVNEMIERINFGTKIVLSGYTPDCQPWQRLSKAEFQDLKIGRFDRRANKTPVTNRWGL